MARQFNELRAFHIALETFLTSRGWADVTYKEGFGFDDTITNPQLALTEMPFRNEELQMGRNVQTEKLLKRVFQVDAYMESEHRVKAIWDDIDDFMDETVVTINTTSYMICDTVTINGDILPPNMTSPKVIRWRGIIRGTYDVVYL